MARPTKIMIVGNICGATHVFSRMLIEGILSGVKAIVFVGNICNPEIIWRTLDSGLKAYGIVGPLDDASIIKVLKDNDSYLGGRMIDFNGISIGGIGVQHSNDSKRLLRKESKTSMSLLVTYYPPLHEDSIYKGRMPFKGSRPVLEAAIRLKPHCLISGHPLHEPGYEGGVYFTDSGFRGHYTIASLGNGCSLEYHNIYSTLY
jgi:Icc-related predicted phosphoesterase